MNEQAEMASPKFQEVLEHFKQLEETKGHNHVLIVEYMGMIDRSLVVFQAALDAGVIPQIVADRYIKASVVMSQLLSAALGVDPKDANEDCQMLMAIATADPEAN